MFKQDVLEFRENKIIRGKAITLPQGWPKTRLSKRKFKFSQA